VEDRAIPMSHYFHDSAFGEQEGGGTGEKCQWTKKEGGRREGEKKHVTYLSSTTTTYSFLKYKIIDVCGGTKKERRRRWA